MNIMSKSRPEFLLLCFSLLLFGPFIQFSRADIGTASQYFPPYTPTACFGDDFSRFPSSNLFAAAGEGIWNNGAACGRNYLVRCISSSLPSACIPGQTIQVVIVDRARTLVSRPTRQGTSLVLSNTAYQSIANPSASFLNVEFREA